LFLFSSLPPWSLFAGIDTGVSLLPWSPLARGYLCRPAGSKDSIRSQTDWFQDSLYAKPNSGDEQVTAAVQEIAKERGVSAAQVALAWLLAKPGVSAPIIGATKPHHISDAVAALKLQLTADEMQRIEKPYLAHPVGGHQ
jgi:aryl-alcohol dehydrogenase-like predicted oxidoreductase